MTRHEWCCTHYFNQRLAQNANLVFHQSGSDAIVLYDKMPANALRNFPDCNHAGGGSLRADRRKHTRTSRDTTHCGTRKRKIISHFQLDKASLEFSKQINADQQLCAEKTENVDDCLLSLTKSEMHAAQTSNLERHEVLNVEDRVQC